MWMHCVQYVALSRADLQRWQNVLPHLMHEPAKPARRRLMKRTGAMSTARMPPIVTGLRALSSGSKYAYVPKSVRTAPVFAMASASDHAERIVGRYITTFCCGGLAEMRSIAALSRRLA